MTCGLPRNDCQTIVVRTANFCWETPPWYIACPPVLVRYLVLGVLVSISWVLSRGIKPIRDTRCVITQPFEQRTNERFSSFISSKTSRAWNYCSLIHPRGPKSLRKQYSLRRHRHKRDDWMAFRSSLTVIEHEAEEKPLCKEWLNSKRMSKCTCQRKHSHSHFLARGKFKEFKQSSIL